MISPTLRCQQLIKQRREAGLTVFNYGLGANPFVPDFLTSANGGLNVGNNYNYGPLNGSVRLQYSLKRRFPETSTRESRVLLGHGLKELLFVSQMAARGKIIHITPSWVSYLEQAVSLGRVQGDSLLTLETRREDGFRIDLEKLDRLLEGAVGGVGGEKEVVMLFNNPNNPTGICYNPEEVQQIASVIKKYPSVIVIADDIYGEIVFNSEYRSISTFIPDQTVVGNSFSKNIGCGGYRCGWMFFPPALDDFYQRCSFQASSVYSCLSMPVQDWALEVLEKSFLPSKGGKDQWNSHLVIIRNRFQSIAKETDIILQLTRLEYIVPNGCWYYLVDFEGYREGLEKIGVSNGDGIVEWLVKTHGIVTVSGSAFGVTGLVVRISLVDFDGVSPFRIKSGLELLVKALEQF